MTIYDLLTSASWLILILYIIWYFLFTDCDTILAFSERFGRPVSCFAGKVVWITGASSGLGEAMAYELASVGAKLILTARTEKLLQNVKEECLVLSNGKLKMKDILILPFDISNFKCLGEYVENAVNYFGRIDVLINNAARYQIGAIENTQLEVEKAVFDVNYFGTISLSKLVLKHFLRQGKGHFVIVSSIAGKFGIPSTATYVGTKHALQGYFDTLRMEHHKNKIGVTFVCPGIFASSILTKTMTNNSGEILEKEYQHYECTNMSTKRCAHLTLVAAINKLFESWIAYQPFLFMLWGSQYFPDIYKYFMGLIYSENRISQLKEGKWPKDLPVWKPIPQYIKNK